MARRNIYQALNIHETSYCSSRMVIIERYLTWTDVLLGYYYSRRHQEIKHKKPVASKIVQDSTEGETAEYRGGCIGLPQIFWKLNKARVSSTIQVPLSS